MSGWLSRPNSPVVGVDGKDKTMSVMFMFESRKARLEATAEALEVAAEELRGEVARLEREYQVWLGGAL